MKYILSLFALTGALAAPSERRQQVNGGGSIVPSTIQLQGRNLCAHASHTLGAYAHSVTLQPCQVTAEDNSLNGASNAADQGWISTDHGTELAQYPGWCLSATGDGAGALALCGDENDDIRSTDIFHNGKYLCLNDKECFSVQQFDESAGYLLLTDDKSLWADFVFPYLVK